MNFPLRLDQFFAPLTLSLAVATAGLLLCWDIIGSAVNAKLIRAPAWTRLGWWLFGWGLFIFAWFIVYQFVPLDKSYIILTLGIVTLACIPAYLRCQGWRSLLLSARQLWLPLLLLLPLFPAIWVKSSLPPYLTDEMAYHFISPNDLANSAAWQFSGGIYHVIPKSLNLFFHLMFALWHTYVPARLLHLLMLVSVFATVFIWIKNTFGPLRAWVFWLIFWFWPKQDLITAATSGYVDIATAGFTFWAIVLALDAAISRPYRNLAVVAAAWALALGVKYSALLAFAAYLPASLYLSLKSQFQKILPALLVFVLLGGFWYVKNLIYTGNPIYPFIFGCRGAECVGNSSFFGDWTTKVSLANLDLIINDLLVGNRKLGMALVISLVLALVSRDTRLRRVNLVLAVGVMGELVLMKYMSGFLLRYFWHLQFAVLLFMVLQTVTGDNDRKVVRWAKLGLLAFFVLFASVNFWRGIRFALAADRLPRAELAYALGKTDIYAWVDSHFPQMNQVIKWCDQQPGQVKLYRVDPDLIWFDYEGMMRVFMTNCQMADLGADLASVKDNYREPFWFASLNPCVAPDQVKYLGHETPWQKQLRQANNQMVCSFTPVLPGLYRYNP